MKATLEVMERDVAGRAGIWEMRLSNNTREKLGRTHPTTGDALGPQELILE